MIELQTDARLKADDQCWVKVTFSFDPEEPFIVTMNIHFDNEDVEWEIGRADLREAIFSGWPSGVGDIIIIRFEDTIRIYLKNELDGEKCSLDFKINKLKPFLTKTYQEVSHWDEQTIIEREIDKWTSS